MENNGKLPPAVPHMGAAI